MSGGPSGERGLRIRLAVPLRWQTCSEAEAAAALQRAASVLQLLHLLGDGPAPGERSESERTDCRHLERKLDVIIAMLGLLLDTGHPDGPVTEVELDAGGLRWQAPSGPAPGSRVLVCLDLPGAPALCLPGTAASTAPPRHEVRFDSLPEPVADALARWIFVRHRQDVARRRAGR